MSPETIGKFVGSDEIVAFTVADFKTPKGKDVISVTFKNKKTRIFPLETLEKIMTDEISDANAVREKQLTPIIREVLAIMAESDIKNGDIEMFFKQLATNIDLAFGRAISYMWFKDDAEFVPGFDPQYDVSLLMAHNVIVNMPDKKKEDEPAGE